MVLSVSSERSSSMLPSPCQCPCLKAVVTVYIVSFVLSATALKHDDPLIIDARRNGTFKMESTVSGMMDNGYEITCGIDIENWTKYPLVSGNVIAEAGEVSLSPRDVMPARRLAGLVAHKTHFSPTGSHGTVSWLIHGKNRRLVIMWSVPFSHSFFSNCLGVGLSANSSITHNKSWFHQLYHESETDSLQFIRKDFGSLYNDPLIYRDDNFEIVGEMDAKYKAIAKIIFFPRRHEDLALEITGFPQSNSLESMMSLLKSIVGLVIYLAAVCLQSRLCYCLLCCCLVCYCLLRYWLPSQRRPQSHRNGHNRVLPKTEEDDVCKICCVNTNCLRLIPCGHPYMCEECIQKVLSDNRLCPFCRQHIAGYR